MRRFHSSSLFTTILIALTAGVFALGGCAQDSVTGPAPQQEEVEVQGDMDKSNDTSTDDPRGGHNH